jgi:hypothetical protein
MRFWSDGLGKRDLVMELSEAALDREGDAIILTGTIHQPAEWAYKVTMGLGDWTTVLKTATSAQACAYLSSSVSVARILGMGIWVLKFILLMGLYRIGSLVGLVNLERQVAKAPVQLPVHPAPKPEASLGGAVERRNTA